MTIVVGANSYVVGMSNKSAACIQHHVAYIFPFGFPHGLVP
jgi:hypothetical protein